MRLISVNEAADRLGLSPLTVRRLIQRGELPHVRPTPRAVRIPEGAVMAIVMAKPQTSQEGAREEWQPVR